jgi:hypothetical protein
VKPGFPRSRSGPAPARVRPPTPICGGAAANHLRFTYLRRYLAAPRGSYGPVDPGGLAVLAGREPRAILRAFPELGPTAPRAAARRYTREEIERNHTAKQQKYAAIRRDAENGMTQRTIMSRHRVGRRIITPWHSHPQSRPSGRRSAASPQP